MEFRKPYWQYDGVQAPPAGTDVPAQPNAEWPGLIDAGRRVEVQLPDGRRFVGTLEIEDTILVDDEEMPLFAIVDDAGRRHGFSDAVNWRYVDH